MTRPTLQHDGVFWRRFARWGAQRGPEWFVRYSPPIFGWAGALAVPHARRSVVANLRRIRGPASPVIDVVDTARTFANYAGCLAEVLSNGSKKARLPDKTMVGREYLDDVVAAGKGIIALTVHTGGWETVGPIFSTFYGLDIVLVMEDERDPNAQALQDEARRQSGVEVVHVGRDPLASLTLLRHLQRGAIVALQLDRLPAGMRQRPVRLFGAPGAIPEGPLRLAALSGAPLAPIFCARVGYRRYHVEAFPTITIARGASRADLDDAAQRIADAMTTFLRLHPTQWFDFHSSDQGPPRR